MADYWIKRGESINGPISGQQIRQLIAQGQILRDDSIGSSGNGPWKRVADVPGLLPAPTITATAVTALVTAQPVEQQPLAVQAPQYMVNQQPLYYPPAAPAPQIVYVPVPQQQAPIQIINNVSAAAESTSRADVVSVNTNTNTNRNVNKNRNSAGWLSGNSFASLAFFMLLIAIGCYAGKSYGAATGFGAIGILASFGGIATSFLSWGRGLLLSLILLIANFAVCGMSSSANLDKKPPANNSTEK